MTGNGVLQLVVYVVVLLALAKPLGAYMARVYEGRPLGLDRLLCGLERRLGGGGHGRRGRVDWGIRAPLGGDDRQFLGRSDADDPLHSPAALFRLRAGSRLPGGRPDVRPVREGHRGAANEL